MTAGVVLAAGRSVRMGRPKAFLTHFSPDSTFLAHLVASARSGGADPVLVVGRPEDSRLQAEATRLGGDFVENPEAARGQLSSVIAALDSFSSDPSAILLLPVDVPMITSDVIRQLIQAAAATSAVIVRAAHQGQHGHPVLFKRAVFDELRRADPSTGARAVVRADPARVLNVETGEPGVLTDIDTVEDYVRVFGRPL
jgi:molybdenum cofactor cytidylyltransferase